MPRLKHAALSVWMIAAWTCSLAAQDRIPWVTDLQTARQMAQQQRRLVLLHFWSEGCMPCQRLEHHVFNQPELIRAISTGYVPVKINAQQSGKLAEYYRISAVPTDIIVDVSGKELYRSTSPQDPNRYIAMLDSVKAHNSVGYQAPPQESYANQHAGVGQSAAPAAPSQAALAASSPAASGTSSGSFPANASGTASGMMENPYTNPLTQNVPPQAATNFAPAYANSAANAQLAQDSAPDISRNGSRWGGDSVSPPAGPVNPPNDSAFGGGQPSTWSPGSSPAGPNARNAYGNPAAAMAAAPDAGLRSNPPVPSQPQATSPSPQERVASLAPAERPNVGPLNPGGPVPSGLDGYCPVTLMEQSQWVKGDPRWGIQHRGRIYLFSSDQHRQRFWADPDRFAPILSGYDPVRFVESGQLVAGKREHGVFYRDRIYLFADEEALQRFGQRPDEYVAAANRAQQQSGPAGLR